jgi:hypothetical protein
MTSVTGLGSKHCCVCQVVCHHIGPIQYCEVHDPRNQPRGSIVIVETKSGDGWPKPCRSKGLGVLGFETPTRIPCSREAGHDPPHRYTMEWSDPT